jgi:hypothetical protein
MRRTARSMWRSLHKPRLCDPATPHHSAHRQGSRYERIPVLHCWSHSPDFYFPILDSDVEASVNLGRSLVGRLVYRYTLSASQLQINAQRIRRGKPHVDWRPAAPCLRSYSADISRVRSTHRTRAGACVPWSASWSPPTAGPAWHPGAFGASPFS